MIGTEDMSRWIESVLSKYITILRSELGCLPIKIFKDGTDVPTHCHANYSAASLPGMTQCQSMRQPFLTTINQPTTCLRPEGILSNQTGVINSRLQQAATGVESNGDNASS